MRRRFSTLLSAAALNQKRDFFFNRNSTQTNNHDDSDEQLLKRKPFEGNTTRPLSAGKKQIRSNTALGSILARESYEESIKEDLPPKPRPPRGWVLQHDVGSNFFVLTKNVHIEGANGPELLTAIGKMEVKVPDVTYHGSTGERSEQQHLVFSLFVQRVDGTSATHEAPHKGGLEFTLTSIDAELVLDGLAVHSTEEDLRVAMSVKYQSNQINNIVPAEQESTTDANKKQVGPNKHFKYRGPYMNELDEELTDEIFDFLDDRGINNAFADFMMAQAHYLEQEEYINWLNLLKVFAKTPTVVTEKEGI